MDIRQQIANEVCNTELAITILYLTSAGRIIIVLLKMPSIYIKLITIFAEHGTMAHVP